MHDSDRSRRLATIRGLLHKAESTPFPEEAETFLAKAAELMSRHSISEALLWAESEGADRPGAIRILLHRPFIPQKSLLVAAVADAFGCRAVRLDGEEKGTDPVSVVGFGRDLELVETLVTSLMVQLGTALAVGCPSTGSSHETASWRRSFIFGFTETVSRRLKAERSRAADEATAPGPPASDGRSTVDIVLADRAVDVDDELRRRHPYVRTSRLSVGTSSAGRRAGRSEGSRADLGHPRVDTPASLGR